MPPSLRPKLLPPRSRAGIIDKYSVRKERTGDVTFSSRNSDPRVLHSRCLQATRLALVDNPIGQPVQFNEKDSMPLILARSVGRQLNKFIQAMDTCLSAEIKEFRGELSLGTSIKNTNLKSILAQAADSENKEQRKVALEDFTAVVISRGQNLSRELRGLLVELRASLQTIENGIREAQEDGSSESNESWYFKNRH